MVVAGHRRWWNEVIQQLHSPPFIYVCPCNNERSVVTSSTSDTTLVQGQSRARVSGRAAHCRSALVTAVNSTNATISRHAADMNLSEWSY